MWGVWCLVLITTILVTTKAQVNNLNTPDNMEFLLDSATDCNGPVKNVFAVRTTIIGSGDNQAGTGPSTCKLSLRTEKPYEITRFKIELRSMKIHDCSTTFAIYDGESVDNRLLGGFDCYYEKQPNIQPYTTSGDLVTFILQRPSSSSLKYDIEVVATPLIAGREPGYENGDGSDYGYNYHRKFPTEAIIGIVGGLFLLIIVVAVVVAFHCYRKHAGISKKWEEQPLSYINNVNSNLEKASNMSKSTYSDVSVWSSEVSKVPPYSSQRSRPRHNSHRFNDDRGSVIENGTRSYSKAGSLRSGRTNNSRPPDYVSATRDASVGGEDYEDRRRVTPVQIEKHIKTAPKAKTQSTSTDVDLPEETTVHVDETVDREPENESEVDEEDTEEEISEEESEEDTEDNPQPQPAPREGRHSVPAHTPNPMTPHPQMFPGQQMMPYPQQFIPVQAVPYGMQPVHPNYPPPMYPIHPKPQPEPVQVPSVKPTDPPVYSYLVQRGYTPLDGRQSPASMSSAASHNSGARLLRQDDSDSGNLGSGVEFMRR